MKGKIELNKDEVRTMIENHIRGYLKQIRITAIKSEKWDYSIHVDPGLEVEFTDEPEEKEEAEAKAKTDQEERLRIEKIKREMMAPDKDKLLKWVASFNDTNIQRPSLKSAEAREILSTAEGEIEIILQEAAAKAEAL